jgi:hypothetical protein
LKKLKKIKMARSTGVRNPPKLLLTKQTFDVFILIIFLFIHIVIRKKISYVPQK